MQDQPKKPSPSADHVECPVCKGFGQYRYGTIVFGDGSVQMMWCGQCCGHGHVKKGSTDETCVPHKMVHVSKLGNCYNRYKCEKCGRVDDIDSSD